MVRHRATGWSWPVARPVTVVGRLDDPLTLQLLDSQGLTIGIENPDLQTAAALTECWRTELRQHQIRVMQVNPSEVLTNFGEGDASPASSKPDNPSKLHASDIAHLIVSMLDMEDRGFVTESTIWATNPK